ncbi:uncharacterized protein LOC122028676 [Zingiber officinale]|uniref:uncharacterized protein LOC122028676 n=1 Tax=Zingiber officinale TaxID=94328 RepID=UPI001C4C6ACF|nr:uncharacterized protein LOC122028676 [Zingiber officinale]XP_042443454.1 uncharacterized protein LOC122028676 [Zingiber officinale]
MLSICSAAATCSSYSQVSLHASAKVVYPLQKVIDDRCIINNNRPSLYIQDCIYASDRTFRVHFKSMDSLVVERPQGSLDTSILSPYPEASDDIVSGFQNDYFDNLPDSSNYSESYGLYPVGGNLLEPEVFPNKHEGALANNLSSTSITALPTNTPYSEVPSITPLSNGEFPNLPESLTQSSGGLMDVASSSSIYSDARASNSLPVLEIEVANKGFSDIKENVEDIIIGINQSVDSSLKRAEDAVQSTFSTLKISASDTVGSFTKSIDSTLSNFLSSVSITKDQASNNLKENVNGAGSVAIDILRRAVIVLEDSLANAGSFVVYSYGTAKSLLPPYIKEVLSLSEEKAKQIVEPVGAAFQKAFVVIEGLERNFGLDPNDPIVQFLVLLGSSVAIGTSYWFFTYGGYSGDLTPETTFELLRDGKDAVLIDVRPEELREKDGVPDLRRGARSKYTSVIRPEIDGSVRKLLKGGRDVDYSLTAVVIRNLKNVKKESKVIVMDANGGHSKAIARSLKKLGVKNPYMVQGGFESWVKNGLRTKELKPQTALTLLNEDAEAIIEDIKPTPTLVIGYLLGVSAAIYAFSEWEKTLQIIGIIGLGQSLYRRVASYENSEDLKKDVRLLLSPLQLGAQAFSRTASMLEPKKIGLPLSPSSTAVRDRVVQAAAKHESQPSDTDEPLGLPKESLVQPSENQA